MYEILSKDFNDSVVYFRCKQFADERGYFMTGFNQECFEKEIANVKFIQQNISNSKKNVCRGLHFQVINPQGKLVQCIEGRVIDFAMDIRIDSPTFGKILAYNLDDPSLFLFIPEGFAHGFISLTDKVLFQYFVTDKYNKEGERTINFLEELDRNLFIDYKTYDNYINKLINYGLSVKTMLPDLDKLILSEKDKQAVSFLQYPRFFDTFSKQMEKSGETVKKI